MDAPRPVITYQVESLSPDEVAIDMSIDVPFNGFFGARMVVPAPKGSEAEQHAKILDWTRRRVAQVVGEAVNHVTFQAI